MKKRGPLAPLVTAVLVALMLATALGGGAWWMWLPVLLALAVVARLWYAVTH